MSGYKTAVGLDLGRASAKIVRLVRTWGRFRVTHADTLALPESQVEREKALRHLLETVHLLGERFVIGLPGQATVHQTVVVPDADPRSVAQVVAMEVGRLGDLAEGRMAYDYLSLPHSRDVRRALLVMARPETVQTALRGPELLGLDVVDIVPVPVALANTCECARIGIEQPAVCVEIGRQGTDVAVVGQRGLLFARRFELGAHAFSQALADELGVQAAEAESLKRAHAMEPGRAIDPADPRGQRVQKALAHACERWFAELETSLALFREHFPAEDQRPAQMILAGGGAALAGLPDWLNRRLRMRVRLLDELPGAGRVKHAGRFAVAFGLAVAGLGLGRTRLSLLPAALCETLALRRHKAHWLGAGAAVALTLASLAVHQRWQCVRRGRELANLQTQLWQNQMLQRDLARLQAKNADVAGKLAAARAAAQNGLVMQGIVNAIAEAKNGQDWITLIANAGSYGPKGETGPPPASTGPPPAQNGTASPVREAVAKPAANGFDTIVIEGYTPRNDFSSVRTMIEKLRRNPLIEVADLLEDNRIVPDEARDSRWAGTDCRLFAVKIKVRQP
ncbi:MAG: pilus assembly protein PilM [Kiritimatiellae bacterium]|nr:pilus assembly protein PilM [Kiritimatiellia bacterium]